MDFIQNLLASINEVMTGMFGDLGPLILVGGLGFLLVIVALPAFLFRKQDPLDKLRNQTKTEKEKTTGRALRVGGKDQRLDRFAQFLEPQNVDELSQVRLTLIRAGYRSKGAVQTFHFAQFALGLGLLAIGSIYVLIAPGLSAQASILSVIVPGGIGYFLPKYWVTKRVQKRAEEITQGFPDALDLMLVCVEAGQSLDQAIIRVAKEMRAAYPALCEEFEMVAYEMKAGKDKTKVLRDMGERVDIQDVNSFVTVLIQSATFGTSVADALRVYASEMRDKRVLRAEEKANKLPTKLTLGTMMFCVPPLLIILIGPSVYGIAQNLGGAGSGF
ncbi:type II secretion system F family protein [Rhodophyticola porphyridii]|uniref:Type II secretion system F family protein n=1 Tax=Rhodophyticola porphyridii TaxID=1852017 RepID=A0A3L9Y6I8_9RHOB|nr:type II secretion system F family protein [Rhodophyticola porphyridii]RMA44032.1 type II secretion system F family protein [Rhodophyticola porphyridii]